MTAAVAVAVAVAGTGPDDFAVTYPIATRFADNDVFGHVNNAVYYTYFDTAINDWLGDAVGRPTSELDALGVVAESTCTYLRPVHFPQRLTVGLAAARVGRSSVTYDLALFSPTGAGDDELVVSARARWVHVYVDPVTRASCAIPGDVRRALEGIARPD